MQRANSIFKTKPYKHQFEVFRRFAKSEYFALFADMGTGKSKMCIDIASYRFRRGMVNAVLVVAPNNVHIQWVVEQFPTHCAVPFKAFIWDSQRANGKGYRKDLTSFIMDKSASLKVFAVNVEAFQATPILQYIEMFINHNDVFIVVDEATRIKHAKAKRSQMIHKMNTYGYRAILTGTPTAKSPVDLWSMYEFLKPNYFDCNFYIFQHRYSLMMTGTNMQTGKTFQTTITEKIWNITKAKLKTLHEQRNSETLMPDDYAYIGFQMGITAVSVMFIDKTPQFTKYRNADKLKSIISSDTFSIRKDDCLDLPSKVFEVLHLNMSKEHKRIYDDMRRDLLAEYKDQVLTVTTKLALTTRMRQIAGGFFPVPDGEPLPIAEATEKVDAIVTAADDIGDAQFIVWASFISEIKMLHHRFVKEGYTCSLYYGAVSTKDREQAVKDFKSGANQVFIGNPATAGFGLNLQNATVQFWYSKSFNAEDRLQAEDRSHRIGVKGSCVYVDFLYKDSTDERVHAIVEDGRKMNDYFKTNEEFEKASVRRIEEMTLEDLI